MTTTDRLVAMLRERHAAGLAKYRTTVDRTDLTPTQWAQHAIEEMLDGANYLMRLKDTIEEMARRIEELEAKNRDLKEQLKTKGNQ
jgi:polyhydroxyalkanoate synthesis regulator phasin